jgi:membrane protease YdiL (CAAX protease family)
MRRFTAILRGADRTTVVVLLGGALVMTLYLYQAQPAFFLRHLAPPTGARSPWWDWYARLWEFGVMFLLWAALPALAAWRLLGRTPRADGVRLGDARFGWRACLVAAPLLVPIVWLSAADPQFQAEYPLTKLAGLSAGTFVAWQACRVVYYAAWEYFFRGFLLFPLEERFGAFAAIAIQTVPSTIIHIGKPEGEMLGALVAGVLFGALAVRTRSVLWPFLLHWWTGALMDGFALWHAAS